MRPEYIECITKEGKKSWCGGSERPFFTDLEHAELMVQQEGRLLPCSDCLKAIELAGINHSIPEDVISYVKKELAKARQ